MLRISQIYFIDPDFILIIEDRNLNEITNNNKFRNRISLVNLY